MEKRGRPRKKTPEKTCTCCKRVLSIGKFYSSVSPMFSLDGHVNICKDCVINSVIDPDTRKFDEVRFNLILRKLDKPYYKDTLATAFYKVKQQNPYITDEDVWSYGDKIIYQYFSCISLNQDKEKMYEDSEKDGFLHNNSKITDKFRVNLINSFNDVSILMQHPNYFNVPPDFSSSTELRKSLGNKIDAVAGQNSINKKYVVADNDVIDDSEHTELEKVYDKFWGGYYTQDELDYLNNYYQGLHEGYKIITNNHKDYAKKIAKASLDMDIAHNEWMAGAPNAEARYKSAMVTFDTLSKSAKFSESTRSVNDVGISSFSKITEMVEAHNWIPKHKPLKKDEYDKLLDYLATITKSF